MKIAISTNWNSARHAAGEGIVDEALELGFDSLELGYDLTQEQADGIMNRVRAGVIDIGSVHAYSPVPIGAPHGYPELHLLASSDEDEGALAAVLLRNTVNFAESVGAKAVVLHAGRVFLDSWLGPKCDSSALSDFARRNGIGDGYERLLKKAKKRRTARGRKTMELFRRRLDKILPYCRQHGVLLCLENLPSIEGFPDEEEMTSLVEAYKDSPLRYWHDMGHGQVRANLEWVGVHSFVAERMLPFTGGIHIHDCRPLDHDHLPPGAGKINFAEFAFYGKADICRVFEPARNVPPEDLRLGLELVRAAWSDRPA